MVSVSTGGAGQEVAAAHRRGIECAEEQLSRWWIEQVPRREMRKRRRRWRRGGHVDLHFIPISVKSGGNQSVWGGEGFMISSVLMDGCYLQRAIIFCSFLHLILDALSAAKHSPLMKATDGQKKKKKSDVLCWRNGKCFLKYWQQQTFISLMNYTLCFGAI